MTGATSSLSPSPSFFYCGRTENATVATSGGTTPGLPHELAVAASFFLPVQEQEDEEIFGPLPPKIPTRKVFLERKKAQQDRWERIVLQCEQNGWQPRLPEETYMPLLYTEPLPPLVVGGPLSTSREDEQAQKLADDALAAAAVDSPGPTDGADGAHATTGPADSAAASAAAAAPAASAARAATAAPPATAKPAAQATPRSPDAIQRRQFRFRSPTTPGAHWAHPGAAMRRYGSPIARRRARLRAAEHPKMAPRGRPR